MPHWPDALLLGGAAKCYRRRQAGKPERKMENKQEARIVPPPVDSTPQAPPNAAEIDLGIFDSFSKLGSLTGRSLVGITIQLQPHH